MSYHCTRKWGYCVKMCTNVLTKIFLFNFFLIIARCTTEALNPRWWVRPDPILQSYAREPDYSSRNTQFAHSQNLSSAQSTYQAKLAHSNIFTWTHKKGGRDFLKPQDWKRNSHQVIKKTLGSRIPNINFIIYLQHREWFYKY